MMLVSENKLGSKWYFFHLNKSHLMTKLGHNPVAGTQANNLDTKIGFNALISRQKGLVHERENKHRQTNPKESAKARS